ncbi:TOBE domain-containing protein [Campylobacter gastrosuis]|uniref:TOBE domain-containing protein n=1 Tax=Campylobacter gastrosuis TaxID=2974576 RepID=A0ABT7HM76_9BACT|nr:TOBE domain-containing protein [Campylobacter gastrosuis]MDL0087818.1 TOBE domain-containing protein [Campylobacter gastrosuis]MDL0088029.1 TOBE domain-containing protein [Campylobacter gastrosuis]
MIRAKVSEISSSNYVSHVRFRLDEISFSMLSLENLSLNVGDEVILGFKSSDVSIATSKLADFSVQNALECKIKALKMGKILTTILLDFRGFEFESLISTSSAKALNLAPNQQVFAYIKSTSIFISEIL